MKKQRKKASTAPKATRVKVTEMPANCPRCKSTRRTGKKRCVRREIQGTLPNGEPFTHVQNFRAECRDCGHRLSYNSYEYHPPQEVIRRVKRKSES